MCIFGFEFVKLRRNKDLSFILVRHRTNMLAAARLILAKLKQIENHSSGQPSCKLSSIIQMQ